MTTKQVVVAQEGDTGRPSRWQRRGQRDRRSMGTRQEVADYLGVPYATLAQWAYKSIGPPYKIIGRYARYDWDQVDSWVASQKTGGGVVT